MSCFQVKYSVQNIPNKGKGIVAEQNISKGTIVWKPIKSCIKILDSKELESRLTGLSSVSAKKLLSYLYIWNIDGKPHIIELLDDSKFTNHSSKNNMSAFDSKGNMSEFSYATRDILKGEELTDDYSEYGKKSSDINSYTYYKLCDKYGVESTQEVSIKYS